MRLLIICILLYFSAAGFGKTDKIQLLILSGSNNHEWQETTPLLKSIMEDSGRFTVKTTNSPDTLTYVYLKDYDAIISNWNSWPDNDYVWPRETQEGLLRFLEEGGGLVFFHSSTSAFYKWPEFKKISTGAWVEKTWHSRPGPVKVVIDDQEHPVTKGLSDFHIFDELWIDAEQNKEFLVLGSAINTEPSDDEHERQPAIFVSGYGSGRIFHTILGHDVRAMKYNGFQILMLRGTEWAATSEVTIKAP